MRFLNCPCFGDLVCLRRMVYNYFEAVAFSTTIFSGFSEAKIVTEENLSERNYTEGRLGSCPYNMTFEF